MKINQSLIDVVINGTKAERKYACEKSFYLFKLYYFSDYFAYKSAPFHDDFDDDVDALMRGDLTEAAWIAFRESIKTTEAKMMVAYAICYRFKRYIGYASYDKENSEAALFDIVIELQTNPKVIADFGHLYTEKREKEESKLKRISSFITANKIKVEAFSTQESTRGRVYNTHRPDLFVLDDIETKKTVLSLPMMRKIIRFIGELKSGMGNQWAVLYLGNLISEIGVIAYIMNRLSKNPKGVVRNVPVMSFDKQTRKYEIAWPDKYVMTDAEAEEANRHIIDVNRRKISIESKKRDLEDFNGEMMNDPVSSGMPFFDRKRVDIDIKAAEDAHEEKAGFRLWGKYDPACRYGIGADTSQGVKLDSNASVLLNYSSIPVQQIGSFDSNEIGPDSFAYELKREGDMFGTCLIAPETNAESGGTCLNQLRQIYPAGKIYRHPIQGKVKTELDKKVGWHTTRATKPEAFHQFKHAYENGLVKINDVKILKEMRAYTQMDLSDDEESDPELATRHFDLLTATVIAWAIRNSALIATTEQEEKVKKAKEYVGTPFPVAGEPQHQRSNIDPYDSKDTPGRVNKGGFPDRGNL